MAISPSYFDWKMAAAGVEDSSRAESNQVGLLANGFEELQIKPKQSKKKTDSNTEFLKSLEPGRRKLSTVESQRIVSVLDDCIRKVEIVTLLPFIIENVDRFSVLLGSELVSLVKEYDIIERNYSKTLKIHRKALRAQSAADRASELSEEQESSRPASELSYGADWLARAELEELEYAVESLKDAMKGTIKTIVRDFGKNPSALKAINVERKERAFEANNFIDGLRSLKDLVFLRLVTSPGEDLERVKQFVDLTVKERKAQANIVKLSANLAAAIKDKDEEVRLYL